MLINKLPVSINKTSHITKSEIIACKIHGYDVTNTSNCFLGGGATGRVFKAKVTREKLNDEKNVRLKALLDVDRITQPYEVNNVFILYFQ